jgi:hypothetical protein
LKELFSAIQAANDSLMKLSIVIRNSPTRDDYLKAASRIPYDSTWDVRHVKEKHGSPKKREDWLLDRLGRSITRRRQYLKYREEHHLKLSQDWEDAPKDGVSRSEARTIAYTQATTFVEDAAAAQQRQSNSEGSVGSQTSYEPTVKDRPETATWLEVPAPPKEAFEGVVFEYGKPFKCPYCYTEQMVKNKTAWKYELVLDPYERSVADLYRSHVFHDLKPYICTFKECDLKMFRSRNEWFAHELQNHRREWVCSTCVKSFQSKRSFQDHLTSVHGSTLSGSQMEALILQSEEPIDKIPASACMLCDDFEKSALGPEQDARRSFLNDGAAVEPHVTPHQFRRHLGRHMEQLALFALPRSGGDELSDDNRALLILEEDESKEVDDDNEPESGSGDDDSEPESGSGDEVKDQIPVLEPPTIPVLRGSLPEQKIPAMTPTQERATASVKKERSILGFKVRNPLKRWIRAIENDPAVPPEAPSKPARITEIEVRELNELIRLRYTLDMRIWSYRNVHLEDRPLVVNVMWRSDAALAGIMSTLEAWDNPDVWESAYEWQQLKEIRRRLEIANKRLWAQQPPWE